MYQPRGYRRWVQGRDLTGYTIVVKESDLYIRTCTDLSEKACQLVKKFRNDLEEYISGHPFFAAALEPFDVEPDAPLIVREMARVARIATVGPMAAVAGTLAQLVGEELAGLSPEVIIENGGDNYIKSSHDRIVAIYAGNSPLSGRVGLEIRAEDTPLGVCTSSGTVGPSISFGKADAAVVIAPSAALADAAATAVGNAVVTIEDIPHALEVAQSIEGLTGAIVIKGAQIGAWGKLQLCQLESGPG